MEKMIKNLLYVALSVFLLFVMIFMATGDFSLDSFTVYQQDQEELRTITVSGEASDFVKTDMASVELVVVSEGENVQEVNTDNNEKMSDIVAALKKLGIEDKDIQTTGYNLRPRYNYDKSPATIEGYQLTQNLSVKIRDLDKIETVITTGTDNGANRINGLNFSVDNKDEYVSEVRELAVQKAKDKASEIEDVVGIKLGDIIGYREIDNNSPQPPVFYETMKASGSSVDMAIESGSQEIVSRIELIYEIK